MKNEDQKLEMVLLQLLEIELCVRPIPKVNELTDPKTPAPVSFAQSVEQRLGAVHRDGCWATCFFLDLERKSGEKVPQSIILMGHYATLKKLHVPLSNLHEPGHLGDLVPILFSCSMPRNTAQHGASKQQHSQAAASSLCLPPWAWRSIPSATFYKDSLTCHWRSSLDLPFLTQKTSEFTEIQALDNNSPKCLQDNNVM